MMDKKYRVKLLIVTFLAVVICASIEDEIVGWQMSKPRIEEGSINQLEQLSFFGGRAENGGKPVRNRSGCGQCQSSDLF